MDSVTISNNYIILDRITRATYVDVVYCYRLSSVVCLSVTLVSPAKMAKVMFCFVLFLRAGVQPTLDPCTEAFYKQAHCAPPLSREGRSLVNDVCECMHD